MPDAEGDVQERVLADILEEAIVAGEASVRRGPELLPVLREAGVVDAGGYGVIVIFAGVVAALRGEAAAPQLEHHAPARISHPEHQSSTYRYCTNFAVTGADLDDARYVGALEELGDSVLVVGDRTTLKVHVHTDDPETAIAVFAGAGEVSRLDVADMRAQVAQRDARLAGNGHSAPPPARACSPSSPGRAWRGCTSRWAPTSSTAGRPSTPRRTSCWPASTRSRPRRSSSCPTAPT